jgi:peptide chain release factor 1
VGAAARRWTRTSPQGASSRRIRTFAEEAAQLCAQAEESERLLVDELRELLVPRDPDDGRDAILEIRAGEGGEESALFAGDLARMYQRWAGGRGWVDRDPRFDRSELGGVKEMTLALKSSSDAASTDSRSSRAVSTASSACR